MVDNLDELRKQRDYHIRQLQHWERIQTEALRKIEEHTQAVADYNTASFHQSLAIVTGVSLQGMMAANTQRAGVQQDARAV